MGYTHYWRGNGQEISPEKWQLICSDARAVLKTVPVMLWREYDDPDTQPEIGPDLIAFNGAGDKGHETFWLERRPAKFTFCKTAYKPYDLAVCAVLIIAHHHAGDILTISSDGDEGDWLPALEKVTEILGDGYEIPLERIRK